MHRVLPYDIKKLQVRCDCEVVEDNPVCEVCFFFACLQGKDQANQS